MPLLDFPCLDLSFCPMTSMSNYCHPPDCLFAIVCHFFASALLRPSLLLLISFFFAFYAFDYASSCARLHDAEQEIAPMLLFCHAVLMPAIFAVFPFRLPSCLASTPVMRHYLTPVFAVVYAMFIC